MSAEIFYTEVDKNLQTELNARAKAGIRDRSNNALNFMLGKVANVQLTAYASSGSNSEIVGVLGGGEVRTGRFQPNEFLSNSSYDEDIVKFYQTDIDPNTGNKVKPGRAYASTNVLVDKSRRIGPFLTDCGINIGDHSFGLLNKATIQFVVPNVERDLNDIEDIYFRPGRFVSIDIVHPESAIISKDDDNNGLLLTEKSIANDSKLQELYPGLVKEKLEDFKKEIRKMNQYRFEGVITNFNFSYDQDGTVNATLNITGTSNVYTDLSMFMNSETTKEKSDQPNTPVSLAAGTTIETSTTETGSNYTSEFYEQLYNYIDNGVAYNTLLEAQQEGVIETELDDIINAGVNNQAYDLLSSLDANTREKLPKSSLIQSYNNTPQQDTAKATDNWILKGEPWSQYPTNGNTVTEPRYITLGGLIHFINAFIYETKIGPQSLTVPILICTDKACISNYYQSLVSANPDEILFLPKDPSKQGGMNTYGNLIYYQNIIQDTNTDNNSNSLLTEEELARYDRSWPGVYSTEKDFDGTEKTLLFPSRIFIQLTVIKDVINRLSSKGRSEYSISNFLDNISSKISYNTGGAIQMKLVSHPTIQDFLLYTDVKSIQSIPDSKKITPTIESYKVPMFANHPAGTIVHNFSFNSTLPESSKNLAYVLNTSDEISESDVAPFVNFMYTAGSGDVDAINKFLERYERKHLAAVEALTSARNNYGNDPSSKSTQKQIQKSLYEFIKFPKKNLQDSQQVTAPVFPFETEFTIDGINGLRYGDVVQFLALPKRYRINTSFSIIGITHNVDGKGFWTTTVKCIMRPNVGNTI